ncbi:MAG TPA: hypothetical protein VF240_02915 [Pyrinomonadaceae bacterium]
MTEKRNKYDTDPLDPDYVRRTEEFGSAATRDVSRTPAEEARRDPAAEEPTRRFYEPPPAAASAEENFSASYPSVFVPPPSYQTPPPQHAHTAFGGAPYQPHPQAPIAPQAHGSVSKPSQRPIEKLGIPENMALALPYAPFFIGLVAAIVELLMVPRTETRTRFHASQGLALQLVVLAGTLVFNVVEAITDIGLGGTLFWLASTIFLIVSAFRVWEGRPHHIAPLDDLTQKINQKFEPRK